MRYLGSKTKLSRKLGVDLGLKSTGSKSHLRLLKKLAVAPGQHGTERKKITEYGMQLKEKQKLKFMFGVSEKQLRRYFNLASKKKGNTAVYLIQFLEKRLDNVVYRLGFAPTRAAARQLVSHRHIKVNDKLVNIPSYQTKIGDVISFSKEKSKEIDYVKKMLEIKDHLLPKWLERKGDIGKVVEEPEITDIEKQVNLKSIIELFSR